ncbi:MAG: hypothetical protein H6709_11315 [Kofleriaceae bacterium]|nr:hypothetical protein [Kofleriaceae bacterium]
MAGAGAAAPRRLARRGRRRRGPRSASRWPRRWPKLLALPARGWRRDPGSRAGAAAFAGEPVDDAWLHALAATAPAWCGALAATATAALVHGHRAGAPLLLHRGAAGFLLVEAEGLFRVAAAADLGGVIAAATALGELLLVPAATATAAVLDRLDLANLRFITDAAPLRHEPWRRLAARRWSNDGARDAAALAARADRLDELAARVVELDAALWRDRPALPGPDAAVLEDVLGQAAALALGDVAWTLFAAREPATPVLALRRFADLDACVTFGADDVRVRVPLGRRHGDLFFHGYMTRVPAVPWLGGRAVELAGG